MGKKEQAIAAAGSARLLEAFANTISASMAIPLAMLADKSKNILCTIGVSVPSILSIESLRRIPGIHESLELGMKNLLEKSPTLTAQWMDAQGPYKHLTPTGISSPWHRVGHGHSWGDLLRVIQDPKLRAIDWLKHMATDLVTKNGVPLLSPGYQYIEKISSLTGISPSKIAPWVSMNIFDLGVSVISVWDSYGNVMEVMNGQAQWGFSYGLKTFGGGAIKIGSGLATHNPILLGSGVTDVACGTVTAYKYYTQPMICGVPLTEVLSEAAYGALFSALFAGVELYMKRNEMSNSEKFKFLAERVASGGVLSALSVISMPVSITASATYSFAKLAYDEAKKTETYLKTFPVTSEETARDSKQIAVDYFGEEFVEKMLATDKSAAEEIANEAFGKDYMDDEIDYITTHGW